MLNKLDTHTQRHRSPVLHLNYEAAVALQALHKVRQCYAPQSTFFCTRTRYEGGRNKRTPCCRALTTPLLHNTSLFGFKVAPFLLV